MKFVIFLFFTILIKKNLPKLSKFSVDNDDHVINLINQIWKAWENISFNNLILVNFLFFIFLY
jgi:hypothetical protein